MSIASQNRDSVTPALWGSEHLTPKGRLIENFISKNDLCLYNDGSYTFFHSGNGTYSAIDLSFASPSLFDRFSWEVHDDCCGSDHFPVILQAIEDDNHTKPQRWKYHREYVEFRRQNED